MIELNLSCNVRYRINYLVFLYPWRRWCSGAVHYVKAVMGHLFQSDLNLSQTGFNAICHSASLCEPSEWFQHSVYLSGGWQAAVHSLVLILNSRIDKNCSIWGGRQYFICSGMKFSSLFTSGLCDICWQHENRTSNISFLTLFKT